jgi:hypothetical protein
LGDEVCFWSVDVENLKPPGPDPAPKGIAEWRTAPVSAIGCAHAVTATTAVFNMPGDKATPLPTLATLALPLSAPAGSACARIAVDPQGNPVAVLLPAVASPSPTPSARASVGSLPSTRVGDDRGVLAFVAMGTALAAVAITIRRRRRGAIPS